LGLKIDAEGLHPVEGKVDAVKRAPVPQNVSELRSFLDMVQYYHSFLPDLATTLAPLHELLKKGVQWTWTKECQQAYEACKQGLGQSMTNLLIITSLSPRLPSIIIDYRLLSSRLFFIISRSIIYPLE